MNAITSTATVIVFLAYPAFAAPKMDVTEFKQAVTDLFHTLDAIVKDLPTVNTATGTVRVIEAWATANDAVAAAGERFSAKHPEVWGQPEPPAEFVAVMQRLLRMDTDYAALPKGIGALVKRFGEDAEVRAAVTRFQQSIVRIQKVGTPPTK